MKTYEYKGFDREGRACRGLVEALSLKDARERLVSGGILAERVSATGRRLRFAPDLRATVYRELGALLRAGIPLVRALDILIDSPEMRDVRSLLATVRDRVREGASLASAFTEASRTVTVFEEAIMEAAERSATVSTMLERLAGFLEERQRLRDRIQSALLYPLIVFCVGIAVAVAMLGFMLPRASALFTEGGRDLPALTAATMAMGRVVVRWGLWVAAALAVGIAVFVSRWRRDEAVRVRWDRRLFRMPVVGRGYTLLVNLRFARTLTVLLQGGVPVIDGTVLAGRATGSAWIRELSAREADTIRHGGSLSESMRHIPPLAETLPGWVQIGEASGSLPELLESAAERLQHHWTRYMDRCLGALEPILIVLIGGFVLLVALSVLLPVLSLSQTIGH